MEMYGITTERTGPSWRLLMRKASSFLKGCARSLLFLFLVSLTSGCSLEANLEEFASLFKRVSVVITSEVPQRSNQDILPITLNFSEDLEGITADDLVVTNGTIRDFTGSGRTYNFLIDVNSDGPVSVVFASKSVDLIVENKKVPSLTASASAEYLINRSSLSATLSLPTVSPSLDPVFKISVVFNKPVVDLSVSDFIVTTDRGGSGYSLPTLSGSGDSYVLTYNAITSGDFHIQLPANVVSDQYGNKNAASTVLSFVYDASLPKATLSSLAPSTNNLSAIQFVADFNADVVGVSFEDIEVVNGSVSLISGSNKHYEFEVVPLTDGLVTVKYLPNRIQSALGSWNLESNTLSFNVDRVAPTLNLLSGSPLKGNSSTTFQWLVEYSDYSHISLSPGDVSIAGGSVTCSTPVITGSGAIKTIALTGCNGSGNLQISLAGGTARDLAGNLSLASGLSNIVVVDNDAPTISIGPASTVLGNKETVFSWNISYSDAQSISLTSQQIVMAGASAGCEVNVSGSGNSNRTVAISGCTNSGSLSFHIAAHSAVDDVGNLAGASSSSAAVTVDNDAPSLTIGVPSPASGNSYTVFSWPVTYSGADSVTLAIADIELLGTSTVDCVVGLSGSDLVHRVVTVQGCSSGLGNLSFRIKSGTAQDLAGNIASAVGPSSSVAIDNVNFLVGLTSIVPPLNNLSSIPVSVIFSAPTTEFNLSQLQLTNATATNFAGQDREYTFDLIPDGDGVVSVSLAAGQVHDGLGNANLVSNTLSLNIDTVKPQVTISNPTPGGGNKNAVISWQVVFSGADAYHFDQTKIALSGAIVGCGTPAITGVGATRTVTVTGCSGDGDLSLSVLAQAASDNAGNFSDASGPSVAAGIDNTAPSINISSATPGTGNISTSFSWIVTYSADALISLDSSYINLQGETVGCSNPVVAGAGQTRTVTVQNCAGNGNLTFSILAGSASDPSGNTALAAGPSPAAAVDNTAPEFIIGAGSPLKGNASETFSWVITYTGADNILLNSSMISLNGATSGCGAPAVTGLDHTRTVSVTGCAGNGALSIGVAAGSASDSAGNLSVAQTTSSSIVVDNQGPAISIAGPVPALGNVDTSFVWTVSYTDADQISLSTVQLLGASAGCVQTVSTVSALVRNVSVTGCTAASGTVNFSIAAGSAQDDVGNPALAATASGSATLDNVGPTLSIEAPTPLLGNKDSILNFKVNYSDAALVNLQSSHVSLVGASTGCTVTVNNLDLTESIISVTNCSADGSLGLSIAAGVAKDALGNSSVVTSSAVTATVDNTPPNLLVTGPSPNFGNKSQGFIWTAFYTGASLISLDEDHVTVNYTGTASGCDKTIGGTGNSRTVTLSNCLGDGSFTISIAADSAEDAVGNKTIAMNPSSQATVDNTPPSISIATPFPPVSSADAAAIWQITYSGASYINLTASHIVLSGLDTTGCTVSVTSGTTSSPKVNITGCRSYTNDSISFKINDGTALDVAGNVAAETALAPVARIVNTLGIGFEEYTSYSTMETASQTFKVVLAAPAPKAISINYYANTLQSSAVATIHHNINSMGTVVIPQGSSSANIPVTINKNSGSLGSKLLQLNLTQSTASDVNLDLQSSVTKRFLQDTVTTDRYIKLSKGGVTCGILENGTLKCWGYNVNAAVGDGTRVDVKFPKVINAGVAYSDVSVGGNHTCGIAAGVLKCWGYNGQAQYGDGGSTDSLSPKNIGSGYASVSAAAHHTCAITTSNQLRCWGYNAYGQIGDGTKGGYVMTPKVIDSGVSYKQVSTSMYNTCALTTAGVVKCWGYSNGGDGTSNQYPSPTIVDAGTTYATVSANAHMCGLTTTGVIKCWGFNGAGQVGDGTSNNHALTVKIVDGGNIYSSVETGSNHTCGLTPAGVLKCWGGNTSGDLGNGLKVSSVTPIVIDPGTNYSFIGHGARCGVTTQGYVRCWGDLNSGHDGDGFAARLLSPQLVDSGIPYSTVQTKGYYTCGKTTTGLVKCWGIGSNGQQGQGLVPNVFTPKTVSSGYNYSEISVGFYHSCFIEDGGALLCSGYNYYGQIGDGTTVQASFRKYVDPGVLYQQISAGEQHTCGITTAGVLKCWGSNGTGQLGDGLTTAVSLPKVIDSGVTYSAIAGSGAHTCGITTSGVLKCWGNNSSGQVGDGSNSNVLLPKVIDAGVSYASVSPGPSHTCGITTAGVLKCWGSNGGGQLGDGSVVSSTSPKVINSGTAYSRVAVASFHTCGITTAGALRCWGANSNGQLGDGTTTTSNSPKVIDNGVVYKDIATGAAHTCGVTSIGWVKCWGANTQQQLGVGGSLFGYPVPITP